MYLQKRKDFQSIFQISPSLLTIFSLPTAMEPHVKQSMIAACKSYQMSIEMFEEMILNRGYRLVLIEKVWFILGPCVTILRCPKKFVRLIWELGLMILKTIPPKLFDFSRQLYNYSRNKLQATHTHVLLSRNLFLTSTAIVWCAACQDGETNNKASWQCFFVDY